MQNEDLAEVMNRYFRMGCKTFTRHELLAYGQLDVQRLEKCLDDWQSQGVLEILTSPEKAADGEIVAKMLSPIPIASTFVEVFF